MQYLSSRMPEYSSSKQFYGSQGINGWFYYTYDNGITYREMQYDTESGKYLHSSCPALYIDETEQNSCNLIASVRRFVVPADGTYLVKVIPVMKTPNYNTYLTIRKNHKIIEKDLISDLGEISIQSFLEYGESLNFEYYNDDSNSNEIISMDVIIKKISDEKTEKTEMSKSNN